MKLIKLTEDKFHVALAKLAAEPLPLKAAFKLKGIMKTVREEYSKYDEVRQDALKNHGKKKDDGTLMVDDRGNVMFSEEGLKAFAKEMNDLTSLEIQLDKIKLSDIGENVKLTVAELESLEDIIDLE